MDWTCVNSFRNGMEYFDRGNFEVSQIILWRIGQTILLLFGSRIHKHFCKYVVHYAQYFECSSPAKVCFKYQAILWFQLILKIHFLGQIALVLLLFAIFIHLNPNSDFSSTTWATTRKPIFQADSSEGLYFCGSWGVHKLHWQDFGLFRPLLPAIVEIIEGTPLQLK